MSRSSWFVVLGLVGCATEGGDPAGAGVDDALRGGLPLVIDSTEAWVGGTVTLTVEGAPVGESVTFWGSLGGPGLPEEGPCPVRVGGACLSLGGGTWVEGTAAVDANGLAVLVVDVPADFPVGHRVSWQAGVRRGKFGRASSVSDVTTERVQALAWSNPVAVDGNLGEWTAGEWFTSTSGSGAGVTWDADQLYVAFDQGDVASGGAEHWALVFLATGGPGSTVGPTLGTQTPALAFEANLVVRRKQDGSYADTMTWDPNLLSWTPGAAVAEAEAGQALELAIPRSSLAGDQVGVVLALAYEGVGFESTYAGVPATAFVDGYNPAFVDFLDLDLASPDPAAVQSAP